MRGSSVLMRVMPERHRSTVSGGGTLPLLHREKIVFAAQSLVVADNPNIVFLVGLVVEA
jgi:hypothetical protein